MVLAEKGQITEQINGAVFLQTGKLMRKGNGFSLSLFSSQN